MYAIYKFARRRIGDGKRMKIRRRQMEKRERGNVDLVEKIGSKTDGEKKDARDSKTDGVNREATQTG